MERRTAQISRGDCRAWQPSRRRGVRNMPIFGPKVSEHQNIVLASMDSGAEVEDHIVRNSESFYVLDGELEVFFEGEWHTLAKGDACYFPPNYSHGARCVNGPVQFLIVFAPSGAAPDEE